MQPFSKIEVFFNGFGNPDIPPRIQGISLFSDIIKSCNLTQTLNVLIRFASFLFAVVPYDSSELSDLLAGKFPVSPVDLRKNFPCVNEEDLIFS